MSAIKEVNKQITSSITNQSFFLVEKFISMHQLKVFENIRAKYSDYKTHDGYNSSLHLLLIS